MSTRRTKNKHRPKLNWDIWIQDRDEYFCDPDALRFKVFENSATEPELKRRMGWGYCHFLKALAGESVGIYEALHIEYGVSACKPNQVDKKLHSWP